MRGVAIAVLAIAAIGAIVSLVTRSAEPEGTREVGAPDSADSHATTSAERRPDRLSDARPLPPVAIARARVELDGDDALEEIEILATVELGTDGRPLWEDVHRWVVLIRDGSEEHRIVDEFVPQGRLSGWVVEPEEGNPVVVVLKESGTAGIELRAFRHEDRSGYVAAGGFDGTGQLVAQLTEGEIAPVE